MSGARHRYYTPREVTVHNSVMDCWVSFLGQVYDLTLLLAEHKGSVLSHPLVEAAGTDISHWFNRETGDLKTFIHPETNSEVYYVPMGRFIDVPLPKAFANRAENPWWRDDKYMIGKLTQRTRKIRMVNMLTHDDHILEVCEEETLKEIQERYLQYNSHAAGYTWKRLCKELDMELTLGENGIEDETNELDELRIREDYVPAIHLYFNDDLTVM